MSRFMSSFAALVGILSLLTTSALAAEPVEPTDSPAELWLKSGRERLRAQIEAMAQLRNERGAARNAILFVGDGMSIATVSAARILDGQNRGQSGEENLLSFERFPFAGLAKTYNTDAQTPDSAGTMTAMITGVKTRAGMIAVDEAMPRDNCAVIESHALTSALELAERRGMVTGVVSTARITHATPAATYAKAADRDWESDADLPEALRSTCRDIAAQLVAFATPSAATPGHDNTIEIVLGGGARAFLPAAEGGQRGDGRNLIDAWQARFPKGRVVRDANALGKLTPADPAPVLGLFSASHMSFEADRQAKKTSEPSLTEMTIAAIKKLQAYERGFLLVVEAGRIDHAHHAGNAFNALSETIELSRAVAAAERLTSALDTLILVTADHSHVFSFAGYPKRGNPILGKVVEVGEDHPAHALDGKPYTTLSYANGAGFADFGDATDADSGYRRKPAKAFQHRPDLTKVDTTRPGFHQPALVPLKSESHSGEDVAIYARGPGGHLVSGVMEQSVIFQVLEYAADLSGQQVAASRKP